MSMPFQYPNITGKTEKEQIAQMRNYLFQLADQLNYALSQMEKEIHEVRTESKANNADNN